MFSFAIYHTDSNKLFIARDRFGVKPLYYYHSKDTLIFASEIKAIRTLISTKVNQSVLANYLVFGSYGLPNESFFEHIHQLAGGHYLTFEYDEIEITRWYDFISRVNVLKESLKDISKEEAKQTYKQKLEKSISLRFRADVPVGFTLSGGVDSSLLLALISQRKDVSKIKAFTFYTGDERYDELPWVEKMVNSTLTNLEKVIFEPKHFDKWHKRISKVQDEPYGGLPTLAYANLFQAMSNKGVKVVLDGQGMDEAWAGYDYYQNNSTHTIQGQKSNPFKLNVLNEVILKEAKEPNYPKPFSDELLDKQYRDLFYTKIPRALRFNDRVSMAATTELREPFLDYNLVEYAFSLLKPLKINKGVGKYLLREILSEYSSEVALAPKRPLQTPQREWLGNELSSTVDRAINQLEKSIYADYFKIDEMKNEWQDYKNGSQDSSFHLWQWISVSELINSAC
jgi:asparagine synthase (glutamine-hydrolysing)